MIGPFREAAPGPTPDDERIGAGIHAFIVAMIEAAAARRRLDEEAAVATIKHREMLAPLSRRQPIEWFVFLTLYKARARERGFRDDDLPLLEFQPWLDGVRVSAKQLVRIGAGDARRPFELAAISLPLKGIRAAEMQDNLGAFVLPYVDQMLLEIETALSTPAPGEISLRGDK